MKRETLRGRKGCEDRQKKGSNVDYPVTFTEAAVTAIRQVIESQSVPADYALRVGIRGGGCGAAGYVLGFDQAREHDRRYSGEPFELLIDMRHLMYILGMEVDYLETEDSRGFVFNNPDKRSEAESMQNSGNEGVESPENG